MRRLCKASNQYSSNLTYLVIMVITGLTAAKREANPVLNRENITQWELGVAGGALGKGGSPGEKATGKQETQKGFSVHHHLALLGKTCQRNT